MKSDDSRHDARGVEERPAETSITEQSVETSSELEPDSLRRATVGKSTPTYIMASNLLFLTGSLLFLWIALWEWIGSDEASSDNSVIKEDDVTPADILEWDSMDMLAATAPFMFLMNSCVDIMYAFQVLRTDFQPCRFGDDPRWEIGVAVLFGMAATCDFLSAVIYVDEKTLAHYLPSSLAAHFYVIMAIFALWGRDIPDQTASMRLYQAADALFLLGSLIDVSLSYFRTSSTTSEMQLVLERWSVASASLWVVNSILYILADTYLQRSQQAMVDVDLAEDQPCSGEDAPNVNLLQIRATPKMSLDSQSSSHFDEARSRIDSNDDDFDFEDARESFCDEHV